MPRAQVGALHLEIKGEEPRITGQGKALREETLAAGLSAVPVPPGATGALSRASTPCRGLLPASACRPRSASSGSAAAHLLPCPRYARNSAVLEG